MKFEWKGPVSGVYWCEAGRLLLSVTEQRNGWLIIVDNADTGAVCASEDGFVGTLDEAKRRAFQMGSEAVAPFVDAARAEEREACAALVDQLAVEASSSWHRHQEVLRDAAAAIRARSKDSKP